jgi:DHA1 family bicyclomycin/chloramphenicol resistance-like MFS transporter
VNSISLQSLTKSNKAYLYFLIVLSCLLAFTSLSTDIYLPAMPQMRTDLHADVELTITGFLIGFSIAQIAWGPLSDQYGRKPILLIGIVLFIIGSIGCALSQSITQIVFWRIIQALGACTGPMLSRAMIRDVFSGSKAAEVLSTLMILMALAPIAGPLLGGQLIKIGSWHIIFWGLTLVGALLFLLRLGIPETLPTEKRSQASVSEAFLNYKYLLSNGKFMRYTLCVTFFYVGAYAFIAGSPFVYIEYYHIDPQHYGWLFALNIAGIMAMSFINRLLIRKYSLHQVLKAATAIAMLAGITLGFLARWNIGGIYGIVLPVFAFFSMNGIISANSTTEALEEVPDMAGTASALLGALQYGSGIVSTLLLTWLADGSAWTMSSIIAVFATAAFLVVMRKPKVLQT